MGRDVGDPAHRASVRPGLCGTCQHARVIQTARGTTFHLCERSTTDVRFPRYPALPVLDCPGFERRKPPAA